ncbi:MAG TPA: MFS transporter [Roseiarcus sp.]|jgi:predicted MFS family arabinose efflux permease
MNELVRDIDETATGLPVDRMNDRHAGSGEPAWAAVGSMALGVFALVTAEFLPASLLTPIAADFKISEGAAGQTVTATAALALLSSLLVTAVIRNLDRRIVLLGFTILLLISNLIAAFALNFPMLLVGRVLLGAALGGFWSMSAALTMRLVPEASIPRALSIIFSGVSAATIFAAPVGIYLGHLFGWRAVFLMAAGLSAITLIAQAATLPRMPALGSARLGTLVEVLRRRGVAVGMICAMLVFIGHFAFFTYLRPFLEFTTGAGIAMISSVLLGFGVASFFGTLLAGFMLERSLRATLASMPLVMAIFAAALATSNSTLSMDLAVIALWGLAFGAVPVAWSTWLTRTVPDETESAGGLLVAAIQLAITIGAAGGGAIYDFKGATAVFGASSLVLFAAALMVLFVVPTRADEVS